MMNEIVKHPILFEIAGMIFLLAAYIYWYPIETISDYKVALCIAMSGGLIMSGIYLRIRDHKWS
jgi:cytochrome c oxidase assembly factor CtaG